MTKVAFVFPGQGSQKVGMGQDLYEQNSVGREVFDSADKALGEKLSTLCFQGPAETLTLTANTQPAILTHSVALFRALGQRPDVVAGHSLGEYSAHVAAGTLSFEDAVKLVRLRGQFMQQAVPVGTGAMAAVLGSDKETVSQACRDAGGQVAPANYNAPGQIVIAGAAEAVQRASDLLKGRGAKLRALPVSAPFHSELMLPAEQEFAPHLKEATFSKPGVPVYVNVDAIPVQDAEGSRDALIRQVSRCVRWDESVLRMVEDGVGLFVEIGPGRVLSGLGARICKDIPRVNVESPKDFESAVAAIEKARA